MSYPDHLFGDHNDFFGMPEDDMIEDNEDFHDDNSWDDSMLEIPEDIIFDHDSTMGSCGWGVDEQYEHNNTFYGEDF